LQWETTPLSGARPIRAQNGPLHLLIEDEMLDAYWMRPPTSGYDVLSFTRLKHKQRRELEATQGKTD
jgi:hypothetical protein